MLDIIRDRNPLLVKAAVELHQSGEIPPNTYVVDLDRVRENAKQVKERADRLGLRIYVMTKQWNRNPSISKAVAEEGLDEFVAVDIEGARNLHRSGFKIGHVGHLVQVPAIHTEEVLNMEPEVWTVYGYDNAETVSESARRLGVEQDLLLKVVGPEDLAFLAQEGGIPLDEIVEVGRGIDALPAVRVVGTTGFPCLAFDFESLKVEPLPNMSSIVVAARRLEEDLGVAMMQVNSPGTSSCSSMELVSECGGTDIEPGSSLWGMAPQQLFGDDVGTPAQVYVTEVSHYDGDRACVLGGGFYTDGRGEQWEIKEAFVGRSADAILDHRVRAELPPPNRIDYYTWIYPEARESVKTGDTAIYFFRPQVFNTRSANIATVSGISKDSPKVEAVYDKANRLSSG